MMKLLLSLIWLVAPAEGALLSRSVFLRQLAAPAAVTPLLAPWALPAAASEPFRAVGADETFYQSDDKSFDFIAPKGWVVPEAGFAKDGTNPRRFHPEHLFKVTATKDKSSVEVTVDLGYGASLETLGAPAAAAQRLLPYLPGPPAKSVASVERVAGKVKGSSYLLLRTDDGRALKAAVIQKRLFAMAGSGPDAEAVLDTFQVFPTNIFCQGASNKGGPITTGTCY